MIYFRNLRKIRKRYDLTQEELANKLGVSEAYISSLEDSTEETVQATSEFIAKLRDVFDLHGIPLTDNDMTLFYDELSNLRFSIDYGYMDRAKEAIPDLVRRADASCLPSFINLCELHVAHYYQSIDNTKAYDKLMASLKEKMATFDHRQHYYYHRLVGTQAYKARKYDKALSAYIKAEKLDKQSKISEVSFYYMYGMILSGMGYATRAVEYYEKAVHHARWNKVFYGKPNNRYNVQIDSYLAYNLSKIKKGEKALEILNKRLRFEKRKESPDDIIGFIYYSLGRVYFNIGDYTEAEDNHEMASIYLSKSNEAYIHNLYHKAKALIALDKTTEAIARLDEGLNNPLDDMWEYLFESVKHSINLSNSRSIQYLTETLIPKLLEHRCLEETLNYCRMISEFYAKDNNHKLALEYSNQALALAEKLLAFRVRRGL